MFSQTSVIPSTIGFMATRSLPILVRARSVSILLECILVFLLMFMYKHIIILHAVNFFFFF